MVFSELQRIMVNKVSLSYVLGEAIAPPDPPLFSTSLVGLASSLYSHRLYCRTAHGSISTKSNICGSQIWHTR